MATCPKHAVELKTWPSGDQYCPHPDPTGRVAKSGKRYCTYVLKADIAAGNGEGVQTPAGSRISGGRAVQLGASTGSDSPSPAVQSARINHDARVASVLNFAGRVFQGQGADQAVNALEFAKMALSLYE